MIEGTVLVEDDHEMLDRRFRGKFMRAAMIAIMTPIIMIALIVLISPIVLACEDRNAARNRHRDRNHRCGREKFCSHVCRPRFVVVLAATKYPRRVTDPCRFDAAMPCATGRFVFYFLVRVE